MSQERIVFLSILGGLLLFIGCDAMQFPGREYTGEYSGTMVRIENRRISEAYGGPYYVESDTTWGELTFTLEGEPWSNVYTYRIKNGRSSFSVDLTRGSGHLYGDKWGSTWLFVGERKGEMRIEVPRCMRFSDV